MMLTLNRILFANTLRDFAMAQKWAAYLIWLDVTIITVGVTIGFVQLLLPASTR
jgi:hypothetical protein